MVTDSGEKISKANILSSLMYRIVTCWEKKMLCLGSACDGEGQIFDNTLTFESFFIGVENTLNVISLGLMLCN